MAASPSRLLFFARLAAASAGVRLMLFCALALWASWAPLGQAGGMNDFRDSHLLHSYEEAAVRTVVDHGQVPLWSPWSCGGVYALGSPQTRMASPPFLLSVLLGARRAEPLLLFLFLVLGMEGLFRYARLRAASALGPLVAAPFFALSGYYAVSWTVGWINFLGFLLMPWALLGTALVLRGRSAGLALLAGTFATMLGFGGTYPVPLSALFVGLEAARGLRARRTRGRLREAVPLLVAAALLTAGACAFRLWPLLETLHSASRVMAGQPSNSVADVGRMLLLLAPPGSRGGPTGTYYVGPLLLVLAATALVSRRALLPLAAALGCAWLATGYHLAPASPFVLLRELPIFESFRYPERFLLPGALYLAELAALGLGGLVLRARRSPWAASVALALCGVAAAGWTLQALNYERLSHRAELVPPFERVEQPFAQARGNRWVQGNFLALNRGSISCGDAYPVPMSERLRGDLPQEEYLEDPTAGQARRRLWSPNRLEVEVEATRPTHLLVNQNWHPGWTASVGEVVSREGLLGVLLPAGRHHVTLRFLPRSGLGGALVSVLAWGCLGLVAVWARRRGRVPPGRACALALVPLAAWAVLALAWREPLAPPTLRNPNGRPILVEAPPPEARDVHVRFEVPVELRAARVPEGPDADGLVHLELFWRVLGPVPRSAGVFVHLVGPEGKRKSADHEVLAGTFFFKNAPRERLLRDAFSVNASDYEPGTWQVRVGLWHASGDGSRIAARDARGQQLAESRVQVGAFTVPSRPPQEEPAKESSP